MPEAKTGVVVEFGGLDERLTLGQSLKTTSSLDNVIVRKGDVIGRKGLALWDGISTAATNNIIGLMEFYAPATAASSLIRLTDGTTAAVEKWNDGTNAWDNITGTAFAGTATTSDRPSWANMSDEGFLVFTNEGHDRPRKYTGSGNTAVLGGTPPYCKALEAYYGFLFLGNTSTDGTFSATADPITIYFSDVPDSDWSLCAGNTFVMDESPGEIRALRAYGTNLICYKSDCIVQIRFVGGTVRFNRQRLNFNLGLLAPLSIGRCGEFGQIFLATDRNLYRTDGNQVVPLPLNIQKSLQETMTAAKAPFCSAYVDLTHETYHLLYQRSATNFFDGRLSYNYRTGEFYRGAYTGYEFTRALGYRQTNNSDSQLVVAGSDKKVYEQESGTDDNGTAVTRFYEIDWHQYGPPGSKYFQGANLVFERASNVQVRISVAADHSSKYQYSRMYSLKGNLANDTNVRVEYNLPSLIYGSWFKLKIEFFHYGSTTQVKTLECEPIVIPVHSIPKDQPKQAQAQRA